MFAGMRGVASEALVREVWFEGVPAADVWYEGVRLYPPDLPEVRDLVLELPVADAYWVHALEAAKLGVAPLVMRVGDAVYHLGWGDGSAPVLAYVDGAFRAEPGSGLLVLDTVGAVFTVEGKVPERITGPYKCVDGEPVVGRVVDLPWLSGTKVKARWSKGEKKRRAGVRFEVKGIPSDSVRASGHVFTDAEYRGRCSRVMPDVNDGWDDKVWSDVMVDGDMKLGLSYDGTGSAVWKVGKRTVNSAKLELIFPAFERSWELRVLGVTGQE